MKRITLIIVGFIILNIMSCNKNLDKEYKSRCRISKIFGPIENSEGEYTQYEGVFSYTSWGAPESIVVSNQGTGSPSYFFQYDKNKRLVSFIAGFPGPNDTSYHSYFKYYYSNNVIVRDSVFREGITSDPYYTNQPITAGTYTYDKWGRVIRYTAIVTSEDENYTGESNYNYKNENPYANNRSIMGTHPVLMFVSKDYHKSNQAVTYNEYGYPTDFGFLEYFFEQTPITKVTYDCNVYNHGHN
ncbi:MAG: hypothetical protein ACXWV5_07940 [Flavitalea sp.]